MSGGTILEQIKIEYRNFKTRETLPVYIDIYDHSLSHKWLYSLNQLLKNQFHLEKNYCFMGWLKNDRDGCYILDQVNYSIQAINDASIGYTIDDFFSIANTITDQPVKGEHSTRNLIHDRMNHLHRYFEDLQGVSQNISKFANNATPEIKWHIRQLNLLCHEFESWALSYRKEEKNPEWICPSQLMCWLNATRFKLDEDDYDLFGIETLNRNMGAVYVGVNKAIGKHHWEVFNDEGKDSRIDELTTTTLRNQTEAAGDFDIEWGRSVSHLPFRQKELNDFRKWLTTNGFDPRDKSLTIGHPKIGQVDLKKSFGTTNPTDIWKKLENYLDVYSVSTSDAGATYEYHWSDSDFMQRQIDIIGK